MRNGQLDAYLSRFINLCERDKFAPTELNLHFHHRNAGAWRQFSEKQLPRLTHLSLHPSRQSSDDPFESILSQLSRLDSNLIESIQVESSHGLSPLVGLITDRKTFSRLRRIRAPEFETIELFDKFIATLTAADCPVLSCIELSNTVRDANGIGRDWSKFARDPNAVLGLILKYSKTLSTFHIYNFSIAAAVPILIPTLLDVSRFQTARHWLDMETFCLDTLRVPLRIFKFQGSAISEYYLPHLTEGDFDLKHHRKLVKVCFPPNSTTPSVLRRQAVSLIRVFEGYQYSPPPDLLRWLRVWLKKNEAAVCEPCMDCLELKDGWFSPGSRLYAHLLFCEWKGRPEYVPPAPVWYPHPLPDSLWLSGNLNSLVRLVERFPMIFEALAVCTALHGVYHVALHMILMQSLEWKARYLQLNSRSKYLMGKPLWVFFVRMPTSLKLILEDPAVDFTRKWKRQGSILELIFSTHDVSLPDKVVTCLDLASRRMKDVKCWVRIRKATSVLKNALNNPTASRALGRVLEDLASTLSLVRSLDKLSIPMMYNLRLLVEENFVTFGDQDKDKLEMSILELAKLLLTNYGNRASKILKVFPEASEKCTIS